MMPTTISIGSGKGGTGKTTIIANLALLLARQGRKVCLADLDLGGADAHFYFGQMYPKKRLTDFLARKVDSLSDITQTLYSYDGLQLIPGTGNTLQTANMSYQEKQRLLRALSAIDSDVLLLDVGAGTSYHALDFFMFSDIQICTTMPDPTSIMNLYTFLQLATIRKVLSGFLSSSEVAAALKSHDFTSLSEVFALAEATQEGSREKAQQSLRFFHPLLIVNRNSATGGINKEKLRKLVTRYLSIEIPELGEIPEDSRVQDALKAFMPLTDLYPDSKASLALQQISQKLGKVVDLFQSQLKN